KEENWSENKRKEHNTYTRSLGTIVATGSDEQRLIALSALNGFTAKLLMIYHARCVHKHRLIVTLVGIENDRNAKEYEIALKNLDMVFAVE
ncbi:9042_t:CDS:2, partial [Funneliformis geosporum]